MLLQPSHVPPISPQLRRQRSVIECRYRGGYEKLVNLAKTDKQTTNLWCISLTALAFLISRDRVTTHHNLIAAMRSGTWKLGYNMLAVVTSDGYTL